MDQQPGRRQPPRQGQGAPGQGRGAGRPRGRQSGAAEDYLEDEPRVVRPFVRHAEESGSGRRQADQGPGAGRRRGGPAEASGGPARSGGAPSGPPDEFGTSGPSGPSAPSGKSSLVPTPMPAPRAVARRQGDRGPAPAPRPMSDLTTTMPILALPIEDEDSNNAPPGEHGHFHDDGDFGRHRGGSRSPQLKIAAVVLGVVAAGAAAVTFSGGSGKPSAGPQAAGATSSGPSAADAAPSDTASSSATDAPTTPETSATPTPTPTRSTKSPSPKPTSATSTTSSPAMSSRPSSAASTPNASVTPPPPPSTTTPTPPPFTPLNRGDTGPAVSKLQSDLIAAGYDYGFQNGTFDRMTQRAVQDFQLNHPGTAQADGYGTYGVATDKALQTAVNGA